MGEQVAISGAVLEDRIVVKVRYGRRLEYLFRSMGCSQGHARVLSVGKSRPDPVQIEAGRIIINVTSQVRVIVYGAERSIRSIGFATLGDVRWGGI